MGKLNNKEKYGQGIMISLAFLISFILHVLLFSTAPMVDKIMAEMELSHAEFGIIFSTANVSLVVLRIPWGILSDKYGYLQIFRLALPLSAVAGLLRGLTHSYVTLLITQFVLGFSLASILPSLPLIVKEWFPENSGIGTGIYISGFALGNGTALGLTPYLLNILQWRKILIIYGVLASIIALLWWILAESSHKVSGEFHVEDFTSLLKDRFVWVLTFIIVACMGSYDTLATWMPKVLELKAHLKYSALFLSLGFLVSGPITGKLYDTFRQRHMLVGIMGVAAALAIFGIIFAAGITLILLMFCAGFFITSILTIALDTPASHKRLKDKSGKVVGLMSSIGNVGPITMPVAFGYFIDLTDTYHYSLLMVATISIITYLAGAFLWENPEKTFPQSRK